MGCFSSGGSKQESTGAGKTATQTKYVDEAVKLYGAELGKTKTYPGETLAPMSDLQKTAITGAGNFADYFSNKQEVGTPLFGEVGTAAKGLLAGTTGAQKITPDQTANYFTDKLYTPAMTSLRKDINPAIDEAFAGPGFFGSGRSHARVEAATDVSDRLSEQRAQLEWDVQQQNMGLDEAKAGRALTALNPAMAYGRVPATEAMNNLQIAAGQIQGLQEIFGFGEAEQTQEQAELTTALEKWMSETGLTDPENLSILLSLLNMSYQTSTSSASAREAGYFGGPQGFQNLMNSGAAVASLFP